MGRRIGEISFTLKSSNISMTALDMQNLLIKMGKRRENEYSNHLQVCAVRRDHQIPHLYLYRYIAHHRMENSLLPKNMVLHHPLEKN